MPQTEPQPYVLTLNTQELGILKTTQYLAETHAATDWLESLQASPESARASVESLENAERDPQILGFIIGETLEKNLPLAKLYITNESLGALLAIWDRATGPYPEAYWRSGEDDEIPADFARFTRENFTDLQQRFRAVFVH